MGAVVTDLRSQLIRDEDEVLHAYPDSEGYWTIGVGRLIDKRKGGGISHEEAMYLLDNDIAHVEAELMKQIPWIAGIDEVRRSVLYNMAFNLGVDGLLKFQNTLAALHMKDYKGAAEAMLESHWAQQVGDRARRLEEQMLTGVWQ